MASELAHTDLAICRAGALTLAELAASGTPAILVPFARSTGGHQTLNARAHAEAGAAWVIEEADLSPDRAWQFVSRVLENPEVLAHMADQASARAIPGAAERIADRIEELAGEK